MSKFQSIANFCKKPQVLLSLILLVFIFKGLVFVAIVPMHQGPDEYIHYATVQYLAEPKEKTWPIIERKRVTGDTKDIPNFNYTQEIRKFAELTQSKEFSGHPQNTQNLNPEAVQSVETEMRSGIYLPYMDFSPSHTTNKKTLLAHYLGSLVERALAKESVFERYFAVRILAIFYGLITIVCAYFIALWSGFKKNHALLLAGIVSFQPQFSATTAIINYDPLLIAAFSIFLLGATSVLKHGLRRINAIGMIAATIIALYTKGIGVILIFLTAGVIFWGLRERFDFIKKIKFWKLILAIIAIFSAVFFLAPKRYTSIITKIPLESRGKTLYKSLSSYLNSYTLNKNRYQRTSVTYWGTFGWLDTTIHGNAAKRIRQIEYISLVGLAALFLISVKDSRILRKTRAGLNRLAKLKFFASLPSRKTFAKISPVFQYIRECLFVKKTFLPENKFLIFFAISIFILQFSIRFFDWHGIYFNGKGVETPGRYFLPNLIPHMLLVTTGLGMFVKSSRAFGLILRSIFALMILFSLYAIFLIIIPRYYL